MARSPQCSGSGVREPGLEDLNVHFHILIPDGVFVLDRRTGRPQFIRLFGPSTAEVQEVVSTIAHRVLRLLDRRGLLIDGLHTDEDDQHPFLKGSVANQCLTADKPGPSPRRVQLDLFGPPQSPRKLPPRCAVAHDFNLHAGVWVAAGQRDRLEHLCRYLARPPLSMDRLRFNEDGHVVLSLKKPWSDGTAWLVFEPEAFVERLCALIWKPRVNTVHYHGVFAPASSWRPLIVPDGEARAERERCRRSGAHPLAGHDERWIPWWQLLGRVFDIDLGKCPGCGGRSWVWDMVLGPGRARWWLLWMFLKREPLRFEASRGPPEPIWD